MSCEWISVQEYARRMKVAPVSVRRWAAKGLLESWRLAPGSPLRVCANSRNASAKRVSKEATEVSNGDQPQLGAG